MEGENNVFLIDGLLISLYLNLLETAGCGGEENSLIDFLNIVALYILNQVGEGAGWPRLIRVHNLPNLDVDIGIGRLVLTYKSFDSEFCFVFYPFYAVFTTCSTAKLK